MIPLGVVMRHKLTDGAPQRRLANEDHAVQALVFDGAYEPFGVGVQVRRLRRLPEYFASRSMRSFLPSDNTPSSRSHALRAIWSIQPSAGFVVIPAIHTARVGSSM